MNSLKRLATLAMVLSLAPVAHALIPPDDDPLLDQMSVRELMRLDTALAVEQSRSKLRKVSPSPQVGHRRGGIAQSGALELVAIYGVGKKLLAEVNIGSQPHIYLRGQSLPVGAQAGAAVYVLKGISGSCVHLERQEETHTLCLPKSVGAVR